MPHINISYINCSWYRLPFWEMYKSACRGLCLRMSGDCDGYGGAEPDSIYRRFTVLSILSPHNLKVSLSPSSRIPATREYH